MKSPEIILPREPMRDEDTEAALHVIHHAFLQLLAEGDVAELLKLYANVREIVSVFKKSLEDKVSEAVSVN